MSVFKILNKALSNIGIPKERIISVAKNIAIEKVDSKIKIIVETPLIYREQLTCGSIGEYLPHEHKLKGQKYHIINVRAEEGLTLSKFKDGSGIEKYENIENAKEVIVQGLTLDEILDLELGLDEVIKGLEQKMNEEKNNCNKYIKQQLSQEKKPKTLADLFE